APAYRAGHAARGPHPHRRALPSELVPALIPRSQRGFCGRQSGREAVGGSVRTARLCLLREPAQRRAGGQTYQRLRAREFCGRAARLVGRARGTDFDGTLLAERALAERWGVIFTPTIVFLKDDLMGLRASGGVSLRPSSACRLSFSADTFYD